MHPYSDFQKKSKPKILETDKKAYTKISFKPDYKRFGLSTLPVDMKSLFIKRIHDIAAITNKKVKVRYNSEEISIKTFQQYINL